VSPIVRGLTASLVPASIIAAVVIAGAVLHVQTGGWRWVDPPLHSAVESLGGLSAIALALVLLLRKTVAGSPSTPLAMGFFAMGVIEILHAISSPGNLFVWFRALASLGGSIGFALLWWPKQRRLPMPQKILLPSVVLGALLVGAASWQVPGLAPVMVENGVFTPLAILLKNVSCTLFCLGTARCFWSYVQTREPESYLFGCLGLLFAVAEFVFNYSILWDGSWWLWHVVRLMAYIIVLGYIGRAYLQMVSALETSLVETRTAETALRLSESQLRQSLDERERLARDLHDSIIQSIYAIGLRLTQCRRLVTSAADQVVEQLGVAINEVNAVIREVRLYISGIDVAVTSGKELEAGMAALIHTMDGGQALRFYLQMDPSAAQSLTPLQATHLLFIAKEAMSNSLRHSQARNGGVSLKRVGGTVRMIVEDDGRGFDSQTVSAAGHGVKNIRARAEQLGASCEFLSAPGHGTRITIDVPAPSHVPA
jgi:signal transduction histidine kinase